MFSRVVYLKRNRNMRLVTDKKSIDWLMFNAIFNSISVSGQCTCPCFPGVLLTSTFNRSCHHDYHQSSERIVTESAIRTSDLLFSSLWCYQLSYGARQLCVKELKHEIGDRQQIQNEFYCTLTLNPFPHNDTFWRPWETSLLKTLWEKEKLLVMSNFSFSHSVFYLFG